MQDFRKLKVWQRARTFSREVRRLAAGFPPGNAELKEQLASAAESITRNIVEGAGAASKKDFARFLDFSIKSSMETEYHLQVAVDDGLISQATWQRLTDEVVVIRKMLFRLRRAVLDG